MIIKGSCRGGSAADGKRLADHLLDARGNERVTVLEIQGLGAAGLHEAFEEMRALSLATRTRRPLYHASISPTADEARRMTPRHWIEAADELERRLGLVGHQRVLVRHDKNGRGHLHIVWNRCDSLTLRVAHDGHTYARHEACARALEARWRLRPVIGAHTRPKGIARPVAAINHKEHQAEIRTGIPTAEVAAILRQAWDASQDGRAFAVSVHLAGLTLANGRRGVIVLDPAGTPHSLARRLGLKAAEVRQKLADLDVRGLPSVDGLTAAPMRQPRRTTMPKTTITASRPRKKTGQAIPKPDPTFWQTLGYNDIEEVAGILIITLAPGVLLEDRGDTLMLRSDGPPTADQTRLMVEAAKALGWEGIRFSGGTPEWQRQARIEAIRQGFDPADIELECEPNKPPVIMPMPDHLRRRLVPTPPEEPAPAPVVPDAPAPAPGYRP